MRDKGLGGLKVAEIVTFLISLSIILVLLGYLIKDIRSGSKSPFLNITVTIKKEQAQKGNGSYIFPVVVENRDEKTPTSAVFSVEMKGKDVTDKSQFEVQYLTSRSKKTIYLISDQDPNGLDVKVLLKNYQL